VVQIELDRTRHVKFGLAAIRDLERAMGGKPLASIIQDLSSVGIDALIITLFHGLKHEDPTLNTNLILKMVDQHMVSGESLQPLYKAVIEALEGTGVFRTSEDVTEGKQKALASA
jgi:hypothetical protein